MNGFFWSTDTEICLTNSTKCFLLAVKAWCDEQDSSLSWRHISFNFSIRLIYLSAYLKNKLCHLLQAAVAQRPGYFICMAAAAGSVPFLTGGDCLSSFQPFFPVVFLNGFVCLDRWKCRVYWNRWQVRLIMPRTIFCLDVHKEMSTGFVVFAWTAEEQSQ